MTHGTAVFSLHDYNDRDASLYYVFFEHNGASRGLRID